MIFTQIEIHLNFDIYTKRNTLEDSTFNYRCDPSFTGM